MQAQVTDGYTETQSLDIQHFWLRKISGPRLDRKGMIGYTLHLIRLAEFVSQTCSLLQYIPRFYAYLLQTFDINPCLLPFVVPNCMTAFLYAHKALSRGQDTREAGLNAVHKYQLSSVHVGPDEAHVLAVVSNQGKMNRVRRLVAFGSEWWISELTPRTLVLMQNGGFEYTSALRAKCEQGNNYA